MTLTLDQLKQLKYHYENLMSDTTLLIQYCGQRQTPIWNAYVEISGTVEAITKQISEKENQ